MGLKKANIDGAIYEVVSFDTWRNNPTVYDKGVAIDGENGIIYPIRGRNDFRPGVYADDCLCKFKGPSEKDKECYSDSNVIDFSKPENYAEIIEAQARLQEAERTILSTVINGITVPIIDPEDKPEMVALKTLITDKHIDLSSYSSRFGPNYNNDVRLLGKHTISMGKIKTFFENLDAKAYLVINDSSPDVPNPIGHEIKIELTGNGSEGDDE